MEMDMEKRAVKAMKWLLAVLCMGLLVFIQGASVKAADSGIVYTSPNDWTPDTYGTRNSAVSPRAIQLKYQPDEADNGKMLITWEYGVIEDAGNGKVFPVWESSDRGGSWTPVGNIVETENQDPENADNRWGMECCPELYELPADVGEMKRGGIICIGCVCPKDLSLTHFDMYYSEDMGRTWEFKSSLVTDGGANYMGDDPVWEPFMLYDDKTETLICYYSDERYDEYAQKLVYQSTKDGITWSDTVDVVAWTDPSMRPGMPIVTQMENGYYVMTYEAVGMGGQGGLPCNYKISLEKDNPFLWDAEDVGITFGYGGSSYCTTLSNGYVAMSAAGESGVYVNTKKDLSGEWIVYPTGADTGYNRQLLPLDDGTLYILSCGFPDQGYKNEIKWAKADVVSQMLPEEAMQITNKSTGRYMCVWSSSKDDDARVVGWSYSASRDLNWSAEAVDSEKGYVRLVNLNSDKALALSGDKLVQKTRQDDDKSQLWTIEEQADGFSKLRNVKDGRLLSSNDRKDDSGNVEDVALYMGDDGGADTQLWSLKGLSEPAVSYAIDNQIGAAGTLSPASGTMKAGADQYFMVKPAKGTILNAVYVNGEPVELNNGTWFYVHNVNTDLVITADFTEVDKEARYITNKDSGRSLCLSGASKDEGAGIFEWPVEESPNFYWKFEQVEGTTDTYVLRNLNSQKVMSVKDFSSQPGADVIQTDNADTPASQWKVKETEPGCYTLTNVNSGLLLTKGGSGTYEGYVKQQNEGAEGQSWLLGYVTDQATYTIAFDGMVNGTVTADRFTAAQGQTVTLTVMPDEGWKLKDGSLKVNGIPIEGSTFEMPAEKVTVTAEFEKEAVEPVVYKITVADTENGTVTAEPSEAAEGQAVALTIVPAEGYRLKEGSLKMNDTVLSGNGFVMPAEDVVITAEFEENDPQVPDYTITAALTEHGTLIADQVQAAEGETVTVSAVPDEGYVLKEGSLTVNGMPAEGNSFIMPGENVTISAEFVEVQTVKYGITIEQSEGGEIKADKTEVESGGSVNFTVTAAEGYAVKDFQINGESKGAVLAYKLEGIEENVTVRAVFEKQSEGIPNTESIITDNGSQITVRGMLPAGTTLEVSKVENGAEFESIQKFVAESISGSQFFIYDIKLICGGDSIQPQESVTVSIPVPDGFSGNKKLYHRDAQGNMDELEFEVKDKMLVFETDKFSLFTIADLDTSDNEEPQKKPDDTNGGTTVKPGNQDNGQTSTSKPGSQQSSKTVKTVKTGDAADVLPIIFLMAAAAAIGGVLVTGMQKKRKQ